MKTHNVTRRSKRIGHLIIVGTIFLAIGVPEREGGRMRTRDRRRLRA